MAWVASVEIVAPFFDFTYMYVVSVDWFINRSTASFLGCSSRLVFLQTYL
jgi:hypothetical protein